MVVCGGIEYPRFSGDIMCFVLGVIGISRFVYQRNAFLL